MQDEKTLFLTKYFYDIVSNIRNEDHDQEFMRIIQSSELEIKDYLLHLLYLMRIKHYFINLTNTEKAYAEKIANKNIYFYKDYSSNEYLVGKFNKKKAKNDYECLSDEFHTIREIACHCLVNHPFIDHSGSFGFVNEKDKYKTFIFTSAKVQGSLGDLLGYDNGDKPIFLTDILKIFKQVIIAVKYLHEKNFLHRDIKPDNIFIDSNFNAVLSDLGLSAPNLDIEKDDKKKKKTIAGTKCYVHPKLLFLGTPKYDEEVDNYSIISSLIRSITNVYPYAHIALDKIKFPPEKNGERPRAYEPGKKDNGIELLPKVIFDKVMEIFDGVYAEGRPTMDEVEQLFNMILDYCKENFSGKEFKNDLENTKLLDEARREKNCKGELDFSKVDDLFVPDPKLWEKTRYNIDACIDKCRKLIEDVHESNKKIGIDKRSQNMFLHLIDGINNHENLTKTLIDPCVCPTFCKSGELQDKFYINKLTAYATSLCHDCKKDSNENYVDIEHKFNDIVIIGHYVITKQFVFAISYEYALELREEKKDDYPMILHLPDDDDIKCNEEIGIREVIAANVTVVDTGEKRLLVKSGEPLRAVALHIAKSDNVELFFDDCKICTIKARPGDLLQIAFHPNNTFSIAGFLPFFSYNVEEGKDTKKDPYISCYQYIENKENGVIVPGNDN